MKWLGALVLGAGLIACGSDERRQDVDPQADAGVVTHADASAPVPPTAMASADPTSGTWPLTVRFDGRGSSDPDGQITEHRWAFGDGSDDATGAEVEHTFTQQGRFRVELTVKDDSGLEARTDFFVDVSAPPCPQMAQERFMGRLQSQILDEVSGIVASRTHDRILWVHNDSGDDSRVYAVDTAARLIAGWDLNVTAYDWEDIAIGPGPEEGVQYLYVGDIGDNQRQSEIALIHRLPEPTPPAPGNQPPLYRASGVETLQVSYPNGQAHNAEALLIDPTNGDLLIASKTPNGQSRIFRARAPLQAGVDLPLEQIGEVTLGEVTGGDFSPDGSELVLRTYQRAFLFRRPPGRPIEEVFRAPSCPFNLASEAQGESITFSPDGRSYFSLSEGVGAAVFRYDRQ